MWGATDCDTWTKLDERKFQSTLPVWGATIGSVPFDAAPKFQSTLPVWGATHQRVHQDDPLLISIHAPRVGSDAGEKLKNERDGISIHAPRVGSDSSASRADSRAGDFNPRSPCGERRQSARRRKRRKPFQSTLPVWGATRSCPRPRPSRRNFNPRSPCGERQTGGVIGVPGMDFNPRSPCGERPGQAPCEGLPVRISIHAPRVGSDKGLDEIKDRKSKFQSTLPVWGATFQLPGGAGVRFISIHAPRVGSDVTRKDLQLFHKISIHAPRVGSDLGERPRLAAHYSFQSTLPVWGATGDGPCPGRCRTDFNPRSPCGERLRIRQTPRR